ncbi:hypothetical protein SAMN02745130_02183 [Thiothrix eikelboomii]|uniref:Uncharacterized protein n=1 Tax=Thiothrix eikelboomii TaxID=92487 RepID=A0A1T4WVB6_9GAMM|nr:hypothetical protein [Thiothrix eikelboomii]SKA81254.1 hypothetical protein SAMN02745130_02183 [Thiothrix eikelboomii]
MNTKSLYTLADLSRMVNATHRFGSIKTVAATSATALVQAASGTFETPNLPVINRPLGATIEEKCLLIAPQGKPEQGVLVCLGRDPKFRLVIEHLERRIDALKQA